MNEHIEVEDLAMYALLLLPEEESGAVRAHLRVCSLCREELHHVREDLATYALTVEPVPLPPGARDHFVGSLPAAPAAAGIGTEGKGVLQEGAAETALGTGIGSGLGPGPAFSPAAPALSGVGERAGSGSRSGLSAFSVLGWAGWAVAAAVALVAFGLRADRNALRSALQTESAQTARFESEAGRSRQLLSALTGPGAVRVNLTTPKAPALPSARATYDPRSGTLLLIASDLRPLPPAKVYELWLIPADGTPPIAAGTFSPDGHGNVSILLPPLGGGRAAKAFGITQESVGGSPTPTLPILLVGTPS